MGVKVHLLRSLVAAAIILNISASAAQDPGVVVFKSGVERVAVAAVVRDSRGKLVRNLEARDFELFDSGRARPLLSVWSEPSPASVALLVDASGSMATKLERARETARTLVVGLKPGFDEVAYFTFDTALQQVRPFSKDFSITDVPLDGTKAFGATSLWDAIADAAERISDRQQRRALVVITDGVDSASKLKPAVVSAIASELDVPVYILVISFALDDDQREIPIVTGPLADLGDLDWWRLIPGSRSRIGGDVGEPGPGGAPSSIRHCVRARPRAGLASARTQSAQARTLRARTERIYSQVRRSGGSTYEADRKYGSCSIDGRCRRLSVRDQGIRARVGRRSE